MKERRMLINSRSSRDCKRPDKVIVNYRDENFKQKELEADDLLGVCIQHEIDHLNGILFIDHLSRIKKEMILKKLKKKISTKIEVK